MSTRKTSQKRLTSPLFELGRGVATPGALAALADANETAQKYIARHVRGDWGDLADGDLRENEFSLINNLRLLSAYHTSTGCKIWILTEADRPQRRYCRPPNTDALFRTGGFKRIAWTRPVKPSRTEL